MDRALSVVLLAVGLLALIGLMIAGWRARQRKQVGILQPQAPPSALGEVIGSFDGWYVVTTESDQPLERLAVHGLGHRAKASLTIARIGIVVELRGARSFFIPRSSILGAAPATWAIGKAVEPGGLAKISWGLGARVVDSFFRVDQTDALVNAVLESTTESQSSDA